MKTSNPVTRAALGIAALVTIAILANWLISLTPVGNRGQDFTENKIHTLSDGTRSILRELDSPVVIRYYASRSTDYMPEELKLYMRRVDDTLKEYASLSKGKLRIENLDPKPDTDAEDSANLDGITSQPVGSEPIYLGLAISCLDRTTVLPFLNPADETLLEYQLSKAVADVTTPTKPSIGIMSALSLKATPPMVPGQQPQSPGWVIYEQLAQSFDVVPLEMTPAPIDPKKIKVLLLFHPADITPEVEYCIDQYLLAGGTVVACVDPFSVTAQMTQPGNPMMGSGGAPTTSTLPTLLPVWGVTLNTGESLADPSYATKVSATGSSIAILTLPQSAMPDKKSIITKDLNGLTFVFPGGLTTKNIPGVTTTSLLHTTRNAGFVDITKASRLDPSLARSFKSTNTAYDLALQLSGHFKTAFPNGKPETKPDAAKKETSPAAASLKESTSTGNVFIIADVDAFFDRFAYSVQQYGGMKMASPINGNSNFLFNILDQATGSKYLIGSRSRSAIRRPFTVIQDMEAQFNKSVGVKIEEFQAKQHAAEEKLTDLQAQKAKGNELNLSPEQEAEIKKLRAEQVEYARLIREQEKNLRRQKDALGSRITLLNVAVMPVCVILVGLSFYIKRRRATRAQ